ncbi:SCO family protein [Deinococcus sp.]|uniref:SCO family protein n=1 Tax=Deinococcus sp. TaxID=47478 RepID=UPI0025B9F18C|nr:SCO family protein [Deinococcus sp.]
MTAPTPPESALPESTLPDSTLPDSSPAARPWYASALLAVAAVTLLLLAAWGYARLRSPYPYYGTSYPAGTAARPFSGTDQRGQPFTLTPGTGPVTAVFFGFTHCPNICPLSLTYLNRVRDALTPEQQARFRIVLVSVDPDRDTRQRLNEYVSFFGKGAVGVRIPEPALAAVARDYGVGYQKADVKGPTDYQINHTTATYLIGADGQLVLVWDYTQLTDVRRVQADVEHVLEAS